MNFDMASLAAIAPILVLIGMGCVALLAETFMHGHSRAGLAWLAIAGCLGAGAVLAAQWGDTATPRMAFDNMLVIDRTAALLDLTFLATAIITVLFSGSYMREHGFEFGEFYALVLFTTAGMMMVVHAAHLLALLIGIETMSLGAYVLTGCWRRSARATEGAFKYYLMGAFATGFLVYGMALVYGTTGGQLSYDKIAVAMTEANRSPLFLIGVYFMLVALVFKVAGVPFHTWAPDAYEGAPSNVTGFMAAGVKAAAFGSIVRLFSSAFGSPTLAADGTGWVTVLSIIAVLTMTLGNLAAVRQENIKRMLAYSSIAHAGYVLVGVAAMGLGVVAAKPSVIFYLIAYTFTTLGTFGVVAWAGRRGDERLFIDDWAGMGAARPGVAFAMTIFLLSLGGVPPTGGFFGKFYLFRAAMESPQLYPLVIVGVLNSVLSVYYYLRVVVAMYFRDPLKAHDPFPSASMRVGLVLAVLAVLALGLFPGTVIDWAGGGIATAAAKIAGM